MTSENLSGSTLDELQRIIDFAKENNLAEIEWQQGDKRIKICHHEPSQVVSHHQPTQIINTQGNNKSLPQSISKEDNFKKILSPMVGTFYSKSKPESDPFVKVGDTVKKGQVICIIEAMKLFNEIEAECDCKIIEIKTKNGSSVEYNQTLFLVEP